MSDELLALGLAGASDTCVVEVSIPARALQDMLRDAGGPAVPEDKGLTAEAVRATFPRAMYHRSGHTVLNLAGEAGWFDGLVDEAFAPGGLRT